MFREEVCKEERRLEEELRRDAARSMLENAAWLERERRDQELFQRKREEEERKRKEKEEREVGAGWVVGGGGKGGV